MELSDKLKTTIAAGLIGLSVLASGCQPNDGKAQGKPMHKDCYGMHIKENSNSITVEFYKEGWQQFKQDISGTAYIEITKDNITYRQGNFSKTYQLEMHPNNSPR